MYLQSNNYRYKYMFEREIEPSKFDDYILSILITYHVYDTQNYV